MDHDTAMGLAATEYERFGALLDQLDDEEWALPVPDCPEWDIRQLVSHVVGGMEANASIRVLVGQLWRARGGEGDQHDRISALQVAERADLAPADLLRRYHEVAPAAVRGRTRAPATLRRRARLNTSGWWGEERWPLGYLIDTVYTRDTWMHRIDVCRATGHEPVLTADHDGRIVADVVEDWARRHGRPFSLTLTGPAGGTWSVGDGGDELVLDALEFCRTVAARQPADGLLTTGVPF